MAEPEEKPARSDEDCDERRACVRRAARMLGRIQPAVWKFQRHYVIVDIMVHLAGRMAGIHDVDIRRLTNGKLLQRLLKDAEWRPFSSGSAMRQRSRYIVMRRRRSRRKWTRRTWRRHGRTRRRTWRSFLRPAFITTANAVWIDFWRYVYYVPPGLREVVVAVMLSFVRDKIRHAFRIQFRIHAEKLPAQATAPFFEHAVMPVGRLGPFAVATAVGVYSMIFCLVRIYPDVLCVT